MCRKIKISENGNWDGSEKREPSQFSLIFKLHFTDNLHFIKSLFTHTI